MELHEEIMLVKTKDLKQQYTLKIKKIYQTSYLRF